MGTRKSSSYTVHIIIFKQPLPRLKGSKLSIILLRFKRSYYICLMWQDLIVSPRLLLTTWASGILLPQLPKRWGPQVLAIMLNIFAWVSILASSQNSCVLFDNLLTFVMSCLFTLSNNNTNNNASLRCLRRQNKIFYMRCPTLFLAYSENLV